VCFSLPLAIGKYNSWVIFRVQSWVQLQRSHNMVVFCWRMQHPIPQGNSLGWLTPLLALVLLSVTSIASGMTHKWNLLLYTSSSISTCCIQIECCTISAQLAWPWWCDARGHQVRKYKYCRQNHNMLPCMYTKNQDLIYYQTLSTNSRSYITSLF
jgi:hypothetical protein